MSRYGRAISTTTAVIAVVVVILAIVLIALYLQNVTRGGGYQTTPGTQPPPITSPPIAGGTRLPYDESSKTVFITLDTRKNLDFNGSLSGRLIIYIPAGWNLEIRYINSPGDGLPHSIGIIKNTTAVPKSTDPTKDGELLVWAPDSSRGKAGFYEGIDQGESTTLKVSSISEGIYWIACGVTGHAKSGMWIVLVSSSKVTEPYYV